MPKSVVPVAFWLFANVSSLFVNGPVKHDLTALSPSFLQRSKAPMRHVMHTLNHKD